MKIIGTSVLLGITLVLVPVFSYFFGTALGTLEWHALKVLLLVTIFVVSYSFIVGELTKNNSQVDKLWSLLPIVYVWLVAYYGNFSPRLIIMATLVTIWGIRLTINFALKGAYQWKFWTGEEDYRWVVLRNKPEFQPRWKWTLFNLFFISTYQLSLILLFTLPAIIALQNNTSGLNYFDVVLAVLMLLFILFETIADIQQYKFQRAKWDLIRAGKPLTEKYQKGFLDKGLWSLSRHPNYFAEQAIWICFYFFGVSAGGPVFNWSVTGCLLLIILFMGSSNFSEEISSEKYPKYSSYQKTTPRFFPFGNRKSD